MGEALYHEDLEEYIEHTVTLGIVMILLEIYDFFPNPCLRQGIVLSSWNFRVGMEARGRVETMRPASRDFAMCHASPSPHTNFPYCFLLKPMSILCPA